MTDNPMTAPPKLEPFKPQTSYSILHGWRATFPGYDGAPDARGRDALIGSGDTEQAAIADLLQQHENFREGRGLFMQGGG